MRKYNHIINFILIIYLLLLLSCGSGGSSHNAIPGNDNNTGNDNGTDNNTDNDNQSCIIIDCKPLGFEGTITCGDPNNDNQTMNFCTHGAERIQWTNIEISAFEEQSAEYFDTVRNKSTESYPKISAFFMGTNLYKNALENSVKDKQFSYIRLAEMLARYNLVVLNIPWLDEETRKWQENAVLKAKELNPNLKVLAYICTDIPPENMPDGTFLNEVKQTINENWKIKVNNQWVGKHWLIIDWYQEGTLDWYKNLIQKYAPLTVFDGYQFDQIKSRSSVTPYVFDEDIEKKVDLDNNSIPDYNQYDDKDLWIRDQRNWYMNAKLNFLAFMRNYCDLKEQEYGKKIYITGIFGPWLDAPIERKYFDYANGHIEEDTFGHYRGPNMIIAAADRNKNFVETKNSRENIYQLGVRTRYRNDHTTLPDKEEILFGLALATLTDSYFFYDTGGNSIGHNELWWFSEYNADLGRAVGIREEKNGYLIRYFEKGIVVANNTFRLAPLPQNGEADWFPRFRSDLLADPEKQVTIQLNKEYYSMKNEKLTKTVVLNEREADILLDPAFTTHTAFGNCQPYHFRSNYFDPWISHIREEAINFITSGGL